MKTDLKPCPFCGGTDIRKTDNGHYEWLYCADCDCKGPWIDPPDDHCWTGTEMADQWNTRTTSETSNAAE
jgi:Lar family restriction alleviation protein